MVTGHKNHKNNDNFFCFKFDRAVFGAKGLRFDGIGDCAKDGGEEFFTEIPCLLQSNSCRNIKDL